MSKKSSSSESLYKGDLQNMISWMAPVQIGRPNPPAVDRIIREKAENCPEKVVSECWSKGIIKAQGPPEKSLLFLIFDLNKVSTVIAPAA